MSAHDPTLPKETAAMLDWWRAAGVDYDFNDDATAWLVDASLESDSIEAEATHSANHASQHRNAIARDNSPAPEAAPIDLMGDSPPSNLEEFHEFWLTAPGLDAIGPRGRIPPRGAAKPELMVLVVDPEEADRDRLLSGPQGNLLANILRAVGLSEEQAYVASALPRHTPMADAGAAARAGLGAVLALHIELVAPERILVLGNNVLPLLQHGVSKDETSLREINHSSSSQPVMVSEGLDSLMAMPRLKARFWRRWIEWSGKTL